MQGYRRQPISQDNSIMHTPIWKSVVQDTCDMHCSMRQNSYVTGIRHSLYILVKSELRASITPLRFPMQQKNLFESFTNWKKPVRHTEELLNSFISYLHLEHLKMMLYLSCSYQGSNISEMHFCNSLKILLF